eukprot:gene2529-279_t
MRPRNHVPPPPTRHDTQETLQHLLLECPVASPRLPQTLQVRIREAIATGLTQLQAIAQVIWEPECQMYLLEVLQPEYCASIITNPTQRPTAPIPQTPCAEPPGAWSEDQPALTQRRINRETKKEKETGDNNNNNLEIKPLLLGQLDHIRGMTPANISLSPTLQICPFRPLQICPPDRASERFVAVYYKDGWSEYWYYLPRGPPEEDGTPTTNNKASKDEKKNKDKVFLCVFCVQQFYTLLLFGVLFALPVVSLLPRMDTMASGSVTAANLVAPSR